MLIDEVIHEFIRERTAVEVSFDILNRSTVFHPEALMRVPVIEATNVMEYVYVEDPKERWTLHDVVNFAPPFQRMWIEFASPRKSNTEGSMVEANFWNVRKVAAYIQSSREQDKSWTSFVDILCRGLDNTIGLMGATDLSIDRNGLASFRYPAHTVPLVRGRPFFSIPEELENSRAIYSILETILVICGLTISFMHLKTTTIIAKEYPQKLQRARIKNKKRPFIKYYVLEINPAIDILRSEGKSSVQGLKKALHICRGHFKDYRDGRGLFGKYTGIYWWQEHTKGDKARGEVLKDYRVKPT